MEIVNIYIATNSANTRKSKKRYGYVLECERSGEMKTVEGFGEIEGTYHEANLIAITKALERMNQSCEIHLFCEDRYILNMIEHNLDGWAGNGFKTSKGDPVVNSEEWQRLWMLTQKQLILPELGRHTYSSWQEEQMWKLEQEERQAG